MEEAEFLAEPAIPSGTAALVVSGSSGALEVERSRLLAQHGVLALSIRWFGGPGQQPGPYEVPIETFTSALDRLARHADRLAIVGTSFGAEAALVTATLDQRVDAVIALAPSSVVWAGITDSGRVTSHWTHDGSPLPFAPYDLTWRPDGDPPAYRELYRRSLLAHQDHGEAASIRVEESRAELVLVGGEDDQVWPGADFARTLADRRGSGCPTAVVTHEKAGHRVVLPGESPVDRGQRIARGGNETADAALGRRAWPHVASALRIDGTAPEDL
ncbi:MAG: hypothetical protein JWN96_3236 [Mycobacterium sp.]|nr:hypothetical protein [Mycobacterium sp.]